MRYRLDLQYDGTNYHGWQIQPNALTVEEVTEKALHTILREPVDLIGCGRTDTGVHAKAFTAHFDFPSQIQLEKTLHSLLSILPSDIVVHDIKPVEDDFHARFSASTRSYEYHILRKPDAFKRYHAWYYNQELNKEKLAESCIDLRGEHEFKAFCKGEPSGGHYRCEMFKAEWEFSDPNHWILHLTANRFLRNMVRAIVGTQLLVGKGQMSIEEHRQLIETGDRTQAGISVPACGLHLTKIEY